MPFVGAILVSMHLCVGASAPRLAHAQIESPAPSDARAWTPPVYPPAAERDWAERRADIVWHDPNAERIHAWKGDVRDCQQTGPTIGVRVRVDERAAHTITRQFGYWDTEIAFAYRTDAEYDAGIARRCELFEQRGVRLIDDTVSPNYPWMVLQGAPTVDAMARSLEHAARECGATSVRGRASIMAGFVQALSYEENQVADRDPKHEQMGVMMPAATLASASGDCDSKAVLMCALLAASGVCDGVLVHTSDHTLVGLGIPVRDGDDWINAWGRSWVLVETTDRWPVGRVARRHIGATVQVEEAVTRQLTRSASKR